MATNRIAKRFCPNAACELHGARGQGNIGKQGFLTVKFGRRRRYRSNAWRKDRFTKVETKLVIGSKWRLEDALEESEDSHKLNTSFIERLNLTVRQGSAYLCRRTACHSRSEEHLRDQLELQRCH